MFCAEQLGTEDRFIKAVGFRALGHPSTNTKSVARWNLICSKEISDLIRSGVEALDR